MTLHGIQYSGFAKGSYLVRSNIDETALSIHTLRLWRVVACNTVSLPSRQFYVPLTCNGIYVRLTYSLSREKIGILSLVQILKGMCFQCSACPTQKHANDTAISLRAFMSDRVHSMQTRLRKEMSVVHCLCTTDILFGAQRVRCQYSRCHLRSTSTP